MKILRTRSEKLFLDKDILIDSQLKSLINLPKSFQEEDEWTEAEDEDREDPDLGHEQA